MKRKFAILAAGLTVLSAALLATIATSMHRRITQPPGAERAAYAPRPAGELPVLWQAPDFEFPAHTGAKVSTADLKGNVWIASFIFTTCTTVCPLMTANTVLLQRQLPHSRLRFVSFSVDPEIDTVPVLKAYADRWAPAESRWLLLRPEPGGLQQLANSMRVALEPSDDPNNKVMHSSMFFLVDAAGAVRGVYDSNDERALNRLAADVDELLGQARPPQPVADGAELYQRLSCAACHENHQLAPPLAGVFGRDRALKDGRHVVADREYLRRSLLAPGQDVVAGYLELMPSYAAHLGGEQLSALLDHLEGLSDSAYDGTTDPAPVGTGQATLAKDPVCAMEVRVTDETPYADVDGKRYHFCAEACRKQFIANPRQYLGQQPAAR